MCAAALSRSETMARVRGQDTTPEILLRRLLRQAGLRPTIYPRLPGKPDLAFCRRRVAIFLDGCFWHGCPQHYTAPKTHFVYWSEKLRRNVERDRDMDAVLRSKGFRVVRLWQHELFAPDRAVARIVEALGNPARETPPGFSDSQIWWSCFCGSRDAHVISVSGPGSLKPRGKSPPDFARLRCRTCGCRWDQPVPKNIA